MLNRRDFLKAGVGLSAVTIFPYDLYKPLILKDSINNLNNQLLKYVYYVIQKKPDYDLYIKGIELGNLSLLYAKNHSYDKSHNVLSEAIEIAQKPQKYKSRLQYSISIKAAEFHSRAGEYEQTYRYLSDALTNVSNNGNNENFLACVLFDMVNILNEKGNKAMAVWLLDELYRLSEDNLLYPRNGYLISMVVENYIDTGLIKNVRKFLDSIITNVDSDARTECMYHIAVGYAKMGCRDRAYEILEEINLHSKVEYEAAIYAYTMLGEYEKAINLATEAINYQKKNKCESILFDCPYINIAKHAILSGEKSIAIKLLNMAIKDEADICAAENKFELCLLRPETLIEVSNIFYKNGDIYRTYQLLNYTDSFMDKERYRFGTSYYVENLSNIAAILIKMGNISDATKLLHKAYENISEEIGIVDKCESLLNIANVYIENNITIGNDELVLLKEIAVSA